MTIGPSVAVDRLVAEVAVGLDPAVKRQHALPVPARAAKACPAVEVEGGGRTAMVELTIDEPPTTRARGRRIGRPPRRPARSRSTKPQSNSGTPETRQVCSLLTTKSGDPLLLVREVRPGLEEEHAAALVLGQPRGGDAAARSGADDDHVVMLCHASPSNSSGYRRRDRLPCSTTTTVRSRPRTTFCRKVLSDCVEVEEVEEEADEQHADQRAADAADAAGQEGAAERHGGDRVEFEAEPVVGDAGADPRREQHAGETGDRPPLIA